MKFYMSIRLFFRKEYGLWYVELNGKRSSLGPANREEARGLSNKIKKQYFGRQARLPLPGQGR